MYSAGSGNEQPACVTTWYRYSSWPTRGSRFAAAARLVDPSGELNRGSA